jgi:bifunctional non-homologous end joining protein LigD
MLLVLCATLSGRSRFTCACRLSCDDLVYVGNVRTGFKEAQATQLRKVLERLKWNQKKPPENQADKSDIVWVEPTLIAEIEFRAWTEDGKLRHAAYKSLREHQDNAGVFRLD